MGMLWKLEATQRQKWALNGVFSMGLLVVAAGIVRTYYLDRLGTHWDITWLGFDVFVWSQLEIQLAIICASAPALRVFFRRYLSDPISRAINSGRSTSGRSANRESKMVELVNFRRRQDVQELCEEDQVITKRVDVSVEEDEQVSATEVGVDGSSPAASFSSTAKIHHEAPLVRSAADFESQMLESLHRHQKSQPYVEWRGVRS